MWVAASVTDLTDSACLNNGMDTGNSYWICRICSWIPHKTDTLNTRWHDKANDHRGNPSPSDHCWGGASVNANVVSGWWSHRAKNVPYTDLCQHNRQSDKDDNSQAVIDKERMMIIVMHRLSEARDCLTIIMLWSKLLLYMMLKILWPSSSFNSRIITELI